MKKYILPVLVFFTLILTGCLETTQEITLNEDGSGTLRNTQDMSAIIPLVKQMGGATELEKTGNVDTVYSIQNLTALTPEEKKLIGNSGLRMVKDIKTEKLYFATDFSFSSYSQVSAFNKLLMKLLPDMLKGITGDNPNASSMMKDMPEPSSVDDYYKYEFSKDEFSRKVDKSKYAGVESDETLKGLRQAVSMGIPVKNTFTITLPRPATKAEGKNVKLSDDKKTVTVSATLDDFFDNPESLEFKIKY